MLAIGADFAAGVDASGPRRPNILFILADDLGVNDVGFSPSNRVLGEDFHTATPFIDALADEGIRFDRFYSDSSCAATRAGLLTGRPPSQLGFRPSGDGIALELSTLPELLAESGYRTIHIGKWHLGFRDKSAWPLQQGYEEFFGFLNQFLLKTPAEASTLARPSYLNPWLQEGNGARQQYMGHLSELLLTRAVETLESLAGQPVPWFLSFWPYAPHEPLEPPKKEQHLDSSPSGVPEDLAARYRQMLKVVDRQVAGLIRALEDTGQRENTLIVFASDNGGTARHAASNHPLPGSKGFFYEGGVRVPMFLQGAGLPKGQSRSKVTSYLDVLPTLAGIAGAAIAEELPGKDLLIEGPDAESSSQRALFWSQDISNWSVLSADGRYRLVVDSLHPEGHLHSALSQGPLERLKLPVVQQALTDAYVSWAAAQRRTRVRISKNARGIRELSGNDFQRAPGLGSHTIAFCLRDKSGKESPVRQVLARQGDLWSIERSSDQWLWQVNGVSLQAPAAQEQSGELLLVSRFEPALAYPAEKLATLHIFWNGERLATRQEMKFPTVRHGLAEATLLGTDKDGLWPFAGTIDLVQLWNDIPPLNQHSLIDRTRWAAWSGDFSCGFSDT
ncbi:MAG: sulfatase-like hydrolase/transferase [Pseudomonadota bacterium]